MATKLKPSAKDEPKSKARNSKVIVPGSVDELAAGTGVGADMTCQTPEKECSPPVAAATPAAPSTKYVVITGGMSRWTQGDVLPEDVLRQHNCDIPWLLVNKAIRLATPAEAELMHVQIVSPVLHQSTENLLAERDARILQLEAEVANLRQQLTNNVVHSPHAQPAAAQASLIEQKDSIVASLQAELLNTKIALQAARSAAAHPDLMSGQPATPPPMPAPSTSVQTVHTKVEAPREGQPHSTIRRL